jgi:hypothetical protein
MWMCAPLSREAQNPDFGRFLDFHVLFLISTQGMAESRRPRHDDGYDAR